MVRPSTPHSDSFWSQEGRIPAVPGQESAEQKCITASKSKQVMQTHQQKGLQCPPQESSLNSNTPCLPEPPEGTEARMFLQLENPKVWTLSIFGHDEQAARVLGRGPKFASTLHAPHLQLMLKCCLKLINAINKTWWEECHGPPLL